MKRLLIATVLCFAFGWNCFAQQADPPATRQDVEEYLHAINYRDMLNKMIDAMSAPMHQMVHDEYVKDKDKLPADFEAQTNKKTDEMMKNIPWDEMIQAMVPSYQKHFTKGDMQALTAFYKTATGEKILREMPAITAESMQTMMPIMRKHMEAVNQNVQQQIAGALRESQKTPGQGPPPQN